MGLTISVSGVDSFDIGYSAFMNFRSAIANAHNKRFGELYRRWVLSSFEYLDEPKLDDLEFNELCELGGDLMILLAHSDTDGNFLPNESRRLYFALKGIKLNFEIDPMYHGQGSFNVLERLREMFYQSWKKRRRVVFS